MLDASKIGEFANFLVARAGGYLRNPIREPWVTCAVCATPVDGYARCLRCNAQHRAVPSGLADAVAPLTYAVAGRQSGYIMRGYKAPAPIQEHQVIVLVLTWLGLSLHAPCSARLVDRPLTHWTTVPSLPPKPGPHPLHRIVTRNPPAAREVGLTAMAGVATPREISRRHFSASESLPAGSHVLVIDDTWATGGHAQSAALALREAGADKVSVMVCARWINADFGHNDQFIRQRLAVDYNPWTCPWTGGGCP